jgi:hypothetical protein
MAKGKTMAKQLNQICSCFGRSWLLKPHKRIRITGNYVICPTHGIYRAYTLQQATDVQRCRKQGGWSRWCIRYFPDGYKQL